MKKVITIFVLFALIIPAIFAIRGPETVVSVMTQTHDSIWQQVGSQNKNKQTFGLSASYGFDFAFAKFDARLNDSKIYPEVSLNLAANLRRSRLVLGAGYSLRDKIFFRNYGLDVRFGHVILGASSYVPSTYSFKDRNSADFNDLEKNITNTKLNLYVGWSFSKGMRISSAPMGVGLFTSLEYTGLKTEYYLGPFTFALSLSSTIPNLYFMYKDIQTYPYQAVRAMAFTSSRSSLSATYRLLSFGKFDTNVGVALSSVYFSGKEINKNAKYQSFSIDSVLNETFNINEKNNLFIQAELPIATSYVQNSDKPYSDLSFTHSMDNLFALKYYTKIGYVHKY